MTPFRINNIRNVTSYDSVFKHAPRDYHKKCITYDRSRSQKAPVLPIFLNLNMTFLSGFLSPPQSNFYVL
jgi:hypothetical protein